MYKIKRICIYLFLSISAFISIFPFFWMIIGATNKSVDITKGRLIPGPELSSNIHNLFTKSNMADGFKNSLIISITITVLAIAISSLAGYGFEVFKSKRKDMLMKVLLLSMMVPFAALMVPLYRLFANFGMINKFSAVIIPSISTAFLIFFFRQNTKFFPREILEAARVDGLNEFGIFVRIYFPAMKSTYAAAAIITFMGAWNNYLWPLVALQTPDKMTLPLVISTLSSSYFPDYGIIMVAIVLSTIPTALVFFIVQKSFVEGMLGSIK